MKWEALVNYDAQIIPEQPPQIIIEKIAAAGNRSVMSDDPVLNGL